MLPRCQDTCSELSPEAGTHSNNNENFPPREEESSCFISIENQRIAFLVYIPHPWSPKFCPEVLTSFLIFSFMFKINNVSCLAEFWCLKDVSRKILVCVNFLSEMLIKIVYRSFFPLAFSLISKDYCSIYDPLLKSFLRKNKCTPFYSVSDILRKICPLDPGYLYS